MSVPIQPLGDRVVAVREEAKTQTASGIYLPDNAKESQWWRKSKQLAARSRMSKSATRLFIRNIRPQT